ncbi:MAG: S41 family peptidase [Lautropia sp.]|nr:S41 family peptidase [Lautropia sp.]
MQQGFGALRGSALVGLMLGLAACGGGDGDTNARSATVESLANLCAPDNPLVRDAEGQLIAQVRQGSRTDELRFMRAYLDEVYLWREHMPLLDPNAPDYQNGSFAQGMRRHFEALLSPALTPKGQRKDRFSDMLPSTVWKLVGEAGGARNFGLVFQGFTDKTPRDVRVALVHEGSPAAKAGVLRGERLRRLETADGRSIDVLNASREADLALMRRLLAHLVPAQRVVMVFDKADGTPRRVTLMSTQYQEPPVSALKVLTAADGAKVGYLFINAFALPLEGAMQQAFAELKAKGIQDLVVDLRYNGGGYVYQAAQLAYMVADTRLSAGKVFERFQFNNLLQAEMPAARREQSFMHLTSGSRGTGVAGGRPLPNLGLKRVYVLTGPDTCSSSESFINGLRGIDVEVVLVGGTTCGKPFGSTARDNCGLSYLPILFTGFNHKGEGDYFDGLAPTCAVTDRLGQGTNTLGDPKETLLSVALRHRQTGRCGSQAGAGASAKGLDERGAGAAEAPRLNRSPLREIKLLQPAG